MADAIVVPAAPDADGWLVQALTKAEGDRHYVSELLPAGFRRYLRCLTPWHPAQAESPAHRWRDLAARAVVEFYPEISWQDLEVVEAGLTSRVDSAVDDDRRVPSVT